MVVTAVGTVPASGRPGHAATGTRPTTFSRRPGRSCTSPGRGCGATGPRRRTSGTIVVRANIDEHRRPWRRERPASRGPTGRRPGPTSPSRIAPSSPGCALQQLPAEQLAADQWRCGTGSGLSVAETRRPSCGSTGHRRRATGVTRPGVACVHRRCSTKTGMTRLSPRQAASPDRSACCADPGVHGDRRGGGRVDRPGRAELRDREGAVAGLARRLGQPGALLAEQEADPARDRHRLEVRRSRAGCRCRAARTSTARAGTPPGRRRSRGAGRAGSGR